MEKHQYNNAVEKHQYSNAMEKHQHKHAMAKLRYVPRRFGTAVLPFLFLGKTSKSLPKLKGASCHMYSVCTILYIYSTLLYMTESTVCNSACKFEAGCLQIDSNKWLDLQADLSK